MALGRNPLSAGNSIATYSPNAPQAISLSVSSAVSLTLKPNTGYRLWASVDAFFQVGGSGAVATTSSHPLKAGLDVLHLTDDTNLFIAGIVASGTGILYLSEIGVGKVIA